MALVSTVTYPHGNSVNILLQRENVSRGKKWFVVIDVVSVDADNTRDGEGS